MIDRRGDFALNGGRFVVFRQALLEGLDALGDVAHDVRNLTLAAEQNKHHGSDHEPMQGAETTHDGPPFSNVARNLSSSTDEHKDGGLFRGVFIGFRRRWRPKALLQGVGLAWSRDDDVARRPSPGEL